MRDEHNVCQQFRRNDCKVLCSQWQHIDGMVRINQMDARLADVFTDWTTLWGLTVFYGLLAVLAARFSSRDGALRERAA